MSLCWVPHLINSCTECRSDECHYTECRYGECRNAECRGASQAIISLINLPWSYQGTLKGEVSLYHWPPVSLIWNQLHDNWQLQNRLIQTSQTKGQRYSDISPFSIPWSYTPPYFDTKSTRKWKRPFYNVDSSTSSSSTRTTSSRVSFWVIWRFSTETRVTRSVWNWEDLSPEFSTSPDKEI